MKIGLVGKPNTGKSTFFSAAAETDIEIANYPFTTIKPNYGITFAIKKCVCQELQLTCNPKNSKCINGSRLIPIEIVDVAGLVPGAYEGKGMGNEFLNDLMVADCLIHIVDVSGTTNAEGQNVPDASYDPQNDIEFLENELNQWLFKIVKKNWDRIIRKALYDNQKIEDLLFNQLSGLSITLDDIILVLKGFNFELKEIKDENLFEIVRAIRKKTKPIIIAANKVDLKKGKENYDKLKKTVKDIPIVPVCSEAELVLRRAQKQNIIEYIPGASSFKITKTVSDVQKKALELIQTKILDDLGNTGVQQILNTAIFEYLHLKAAYPVEDENKFTDKDGNVLPDAYLLPETATALDLAFKVHSDIGNNLVAAFDAKEKRKIAKDALLKDNAVIKFYHKS